MQEKRRLEAEVKFTKESYNSDSEKSPADSEDQPYAQTARDLSTKHPH
jgi:hypothetical protein